MKKQLFILLLIFNLLYSCNNEKFKSHNSEKENSSINDFSKDSITDNYNKSGTLSFKFSTDKNGDSLKAIKIYSSNKLLQEISVNELFETEIKKYELVDVNFDGFKDILVLKGSGSGGNTYWVWNYSAKDNTFHLNNELSDRFGLEIDSVHKLIMFSYSGGFDVKSWDTFKYKNDKLFLLSSRHIDGKDTVTTISRFE